MEAFRKLACVAFVLCACGSGSDPKVCDQSKSEESECGSYCDGVIADMTSMNMCSMPAERFVYCRESKCMCQC